MRVRPLIQANLGLRHQLTSPVDNGVIQSSLVTAAGTPAVSQRSAGPVVHWLAIVVVVVALGHLTHRKHIFHESHVPSQQT